MPTCVCATLGLCAPGAGESAADATTCVCLIGDKAAVVAGNAAAAASSLDVLEWSLCMTSPCNRSPACSSDMANFAASPPTTTPDCVIFGAAGCVGAGSAITRMGCNGDRWVPAVLFSSVMPNPGAANLGMRLAALCSSRAGAFPCLREASSLSSSGARCIAAFGGEDSRSALRVGRASTRLPITAA